MADSGGGPENKKRWNIGKLGIAGSGGIVVADAVAIYFDKGITPIQIISFFNSWPGVILGICVCITYYKIVQLCQDGETKRNEQNTKRDIAQENVELSKQLAIAETKIDALQREIDRLKQNDNKGGEKGFDHRFLIGGKGGV